MNLIINKTHETQSRVPFPSSFFTFPVKTALSPAVNTQKMCALHSRHYEFLWSSVSVYFPGNTKEFAMRIWARYHLQKPRRDARLNHFTPVQDSRGAKLKSLVCACSQWVTRCRNMNGLGNFPPENVTFFGFKRRWTESVCWTEFSSRSEWTFPHVCLCRQSSCLRP